MPTPLYLETQRLPASYANFYIANGVVLVPVFGCAEDDAACAIIRGCFPGRRVVPVDCRVLVAGLGHAPLPHSAGPRGAARGAAMSPRYCGARRDFLLFHALTGA